MWNNISYIIIFKFLNYLNININVCKIAVKIWSIWLNLCWKWHFNRIGVSIIYYILIYVTNFFLVFILVLHQSGIKSLGFHINFQIHGRSRVLKKKKTTVHCHCSYNTVHRHFSKKKKTFLAKIEKILAHMTHHR